MLQRAAKMRVGRAKSTGVSKCRAAGRANNMNKRVEMIKGGEKKYRERKRSQEEEKRERKL